MKKINTISCLALFVCMLTISAHATIPIVWQKDLNHTARNDISGLKLTPTNDNLIIFHYTAPADGVPVPGRFEKLDASNGNVIWLKTVTKPGQRIAISGWVDNNENIYFGGSWGCYTLWKYNSTLSTQLGSYTGGTGFEYVLNIITDDSGNIYAAGHVGSWSGAPSTVVKLNSNCSLIWSSTIGSYTGSKDIFTYGLALDSIGNVFHVGHDYHPGFPACRGRVIGHLASNGSVFLNKLVDESNSGAYGVIADAEDKIYVGYSYNLWKPDQTYTLAERSVLLKLNENGSIAWKYTFDDVGMYLPWGCIVKHTDNSFYVAFNLHKNGTVYPGIAEIDSEGNLLWKDTIDKPGWEIAQSSFGADGEYLYLGLNNPNDDTKTQVLCLRKPVTEPPCPPMPSHDPWSFVHMTDTHFGALSVSPNDFINPFLAVYAIANTDPKPEFILVTGDIAHFGCDNTSVCTYSLAPYLAYLSLVKFANYMGMDVYSVPGNHDRRQFPGEPLVSQDCLFGLSCYNLLVTPTQPDGTTPLDAIDDYYFNANGGLLFIGLDSGPGFPHGEGLFTAQIDALKNLDSCAPKVIFMHHPGVDVDDGWPDEDVSIGNYEEQFLNWCESSNVRLVLAGHSHQDHIYDKSGNPLSPDSTKRPMFVQTPSAAAQVTEFPIPQEDVGYRFVHVEGSELYPQAYAKLATLEEYSYPIVLAMLLSPADLHMYDSSGRHVGILDSGQAEWGIPRSVHIGHYLVAAESGYTASPETIIVFEPSDNYLYEVIGREKGTYGLNISSTGGGGAIAFRAREIPISPGERHIYTVDWVALSAGEEGVTLNIDANGDGIFERTIIADEDLTAAEFALQTETAIDFEPDVLNLASRAKVVTVYIELPEGFDVSGIVPSSVKLNDSVSALPKPVQIGDYDIDGVPDLMVKFDCAQVAQVLEAGRQIVTLRGQLADETLFAGIDTIRVMGSGSSTATESKPESVVPRENTAAKQRKPTTAEADAADAGASEAFDVEEGVAFMLLEACQTISELGPKSFNSEESAIGLTNTIDAMFAMLDDGLYFEALAVLDNDVLQRTDGCATIGQADEDDWIRSAEGQALVYPLVVETMELLESLI